MIKTSVSLPETLHAKIVKFAKKEEKSISCAIAELAELGLLVEKNKKEKNAPEAISKIDAYCNMRIIQTHEILKELVKTHLPIEADKIKKINKETIEKYNELINRS